MTESNPSPSKTSCPNEVLKRMYATRQVLDAEGNPRPLHSTIAPAYADALYCFVLQHKPRVAVEIGMSYGASTLGILTALRESGSGGKLISIDPYQNRHEKGIGLLNVRRSGLESQHEFIEKPSYVALPELLAKPLRVDFAYIDGWHTFDYALLDFFYLDKMMGPGGVIAFNDCGWRAIHHVVKFVKTHRKYKELDVGLSPSYRSRNLLFALIKRIEGRSGTDRYFRKIEEWEPTWNFFKRF